MDTSTVGGQRLRLAVSRNQKNYRLVGGISAQIRAGRWNLECTGLQALVNESNDSQRTRKTRSYGGPPFFRRAGGTHRHCCCSFPPGCPLFRFTGGLLVRHHHRHCNAIDARGRSTDFRSSFHWNGCRSRRRRPSRCLFSRQCSCARNSRLCYGCYLCAPSRGAGNLSLCEHHLATRGESGWLVAVDRFFEVSIGIGVGLVVSAVWPESKSEVSLRNQPEEPGATGTDQKAPKPEISA